MQAPPANIDCVQTIFTPVGPILATWTPLGLYACRFEDRSASQGATAVAEAPAVITTQGQSDPTSMLPGRQTPLAASQIELAAAFEHYFAEGIFNWDLERLDWSETTPFRRRVLDCCYSIPPGSTVSYGELAVRAGRPAAARAVGTAMATNRWPILIPCHRVIAAGGMGGYSGTGGLATKHSLLEHERRHTKPSEEKEFEPLFHSLFAGQ